MTAATRIAPAALLAAALLGCIDPSDRRPGLWLSGDVAQSLPADWSFANEHREIAIEVSTPYGIPHSVTIWCAADGGDLYVGARDPDQKSWPGWVQRWPEVRLGIADRIYEVKLARVDDPARIAEIRRAYAAKYDLDPPAGDAPPIRYWRVVSRS